MTYTPDTRNNVPAGDMPAPRTPRATGSTGVTPRHRKADTPARRVIKSLPPVHTTLDRAALLEAIRAMLRKRR